MSEYDSRPDTWKHIHTVQGFLFEVIGDLLGRAYGHDQSKLYSPEREGFDEYTPKLRETTYGSPEYQQYLQEMKAILDRHYGANSHHPEHYEDGIAGMDLLDLIEMLADWRAATERHADGDILRSLEQNRERFGIDDQLAQVLENTVRRLAWD